MSSVNYLEQILNRQQKAPYLGSGFAVCLGQKAGYSDPSGGLNSSDGKDMTARFLITTATKDRHGDVVIPDGCKDYLDEYERNPVVLLNHNQDGLPIATSTLDFTGRGVVATAKFHGKTRESDEAFALVDCGVLRGCSIGFSPKEAEIHEGKLEKLEDGGVVKFEPYISFTFLKWVLLEWSVVAVPANADAVRLSLEKGIDGRPLSEPFRRYLEPLAEGKKAWSPGATLKSEEAPGERRSPKKPGEQFIAHVVRSLGSLAQHCQAATAEIDHPGICDLAQKAAEQFYGLKATYQEKGAKHYPDVDFDVTEPTEKSNPSEPVVTVPDKSLDLDTIRQALKHVADMQEQLGNRLRKATGK